MNMSITYTFERLHDPLYTTTDIAVYFEENSFQVINQTECERASSRTVLSPFYAF